jgi:hypothetical protein
MPRNLAEANGMLSWRGAVDSSTDLGGVFMSLLPNGHRIIRGASSETVLGKQLMQFSQRRYGNPRRTQAHPSTSGGIEHPCCYRNDNAGRRLDVNHIAAGTPLDILTSNSASIQRMPTVMDLYLLPDMGRMTA